MKNKFTWKHLGVLGIAIALIIGLFSVKGFAEETVGGTEMYLKDFKAYVDYEVRSDEDGEYIWIGNPASNADNNVSATTGKNWNNTVFIIPERVIMSDGSKIPVKEIGDYAFRKEGRLLDVKLSNTLREIGDYAFFNTSIGESTNIKGEVAIPASVESIGAFAFADNIGLKKVVAENNGAGNAALLTIGENAFSYAAETPKTSKISVEINRPVTIGDYGFADSRVESVLLTSAETIGKYAFKDSFLTAFNIPATLTDIGEGAFTGNSEELTITFDSVAEEEAGADLTIGDYAFSNYCEGGSSDDMSVTAVTLPDDRNVVIGKGAFQGNTNMSVLNLGSTVSVGDHAFDSCGKDESEKITWPESIESVGKYAFHECRLLGVVDAKNITSAGDMAFAASSIIELTLPAARNGMGEYVFASLDRLETVTVPETGWPEIPTGFFAQLEGSARVPGVKTVTIENGETENGETKKVCDSAFAGCVNLNTVTMPSVENVGNKAFFGCVAMNNLSMAAAQTIGDSAFENVASEATDIAPLTWPKGVTSIGNRAFWNCQLLETVTMHGENHLGVSAFEKSSIKKLTLPAVQPAGGDGEGDFATAVRIFADCDKLTAVTIPSAWELVPNETFYDCDSIPTVTVKGAAKLSDLAFYSCDALTTVTAQSATAIGNETFADCAALATVDAQSAVTVGNKAFFGCPALATANIHAATDVGDAAFFGCKKLATLDISSLANVGVEAFVEVGKDADGINYTLKTEPTSTLKNVGAGAFIDSRIFTDKNLILSDCTVGEAAFAGQNLAAVTFAGGCSTAKSAFAGTQFGDLTISGSTPNTIGTEDGDTVFGAGEYTFTQATKDKATFGAASFGKLTVTGAKTAILDNAFTGVTFTGLEISGNETSIGKNAFANSKLSGAINVTGNKVKFGESAFLGAQFTNVPISVTGTGVEIGKTAFQGTDIVSLTITGSGAKIQESAFQDTTVAGDVSITGANVNIGSSAFRSVNGATIGGNVSITGGGTIGDHAFASTTINGGNGSVEINGNVGNYAFVGAKFRKLTMGSGTIGAYAFANAETAVKREPNTHDASGRDTTLKEVHISPVTEIKEYAFCDRAGITTIEFPAVAPSGAGAFRGCLGLGPTITVNWKVLKNETFYGCDGITTLKLPDAEEVENFVFTTRGTNKDNRTQVIFGKSGVKILDQAFQNHTTTKQNSFLEIHLENCVAYSVSGWENGWGAWKDGQHIILGETNEAPASGLMDLDHYQYWVFWKKIVKQDDLLAIFDMPRVKLAEEDGGYKVIGSKYDTRVDIYTFLGWVQANDTYTGEVGSFIWDEDVKEAIEAAGLTVGDRPTGTNIVIAGGTWTYEDGPREGETVNAFYYYAHTARDRQVGNGDTNVDSWDYRYGLFCLVNGIEQNNTLPLLQEGTPIEENGLPIKIGDTFLFKPETQTYDFDAYLRLLYPIGTDTGEYNVKTINGVKDSNNIYAFAFQPVGGYNYGFWKIYVPATVQRIGDNAFKGETYLMNLTGENASGTIDDPALNLTGTFTNGISVGTSAFQGCTALKKIVFQSVGNIADSAFYGCSALTSVTINGLTNEVGGEKQINIGKVAFKDCTSLTTVKFADNLTGLCVLGVHETTTQNNGKKAGTFYNDKNLKTLGFGKLDIDIGYSSFRECTGLETINWTNNNVCYAGPYAFYNCTGLNSVTIGRMGSSEQKAEIAPYAFYNCKKLQSFTVNAGYLTKIRNNAFNLAFSNNGVTNGSFNMKAPDGQTEKIAVELIENNAFSQTAYSKSGTTYGLTTITFDQVGTINENAFAFSNNPNLTGRTLTIDTLGVDGENGNLNAGALKNARLQTISINNGTISTIGANAFEGNAKLTDVTLPIVGELGKYAFKNCPGLTNVTFKKITTIDSYAFSDDAEENPAYAKSLKSVTIEEPSVKTIGDHAFYNAGADPDVTTKLDWGVLNTTLETIGDSAFEECTLLGTVILPGGENVSIGSDVFKSSSVMEVKFDNDPPATMGTGLFENCQRITEVAFQNENWTAIPDGMFKECKNIADVDFGWVTVIGASAFENAGTADGITPHVDIPNQIISVGDSAFSGCGFIHDVDLSGVNTAGGIGDSAFSGSTVSTVKLPENYVAEIEGVTKGESAFENCQNITTVTVPGVWTTVPGTMFAGCSNLTDLTINGKDNAGDTVPHVGASIVAGCKELQTVTINGEVEIGDAAFSGKNPEHDGATGLVTVSDAPFAEHATIIMDDVKTVGQYAFGGCANLETVKMGAIEHIGNYAFSGCTSLADINADELKLMEHNFFRRNTTGYTTADYPLNTITYLYHYDPANNDVWTPFSEYDGVNINHNWTFAMCTLPYTTQSIGKYAFCGTPMTDLYIEDVKMGSTSDEHRDVLKPDSVSVTDFEDTAFAGSNLGYIFIQHSFNATSGAPWFGGAENGPSVEWDNGVYGDPDTGLYYNYITGQIVGVYDQTKTIIDEFPHSLSDGRGLNNDIPMTGIDTNTFFMGNAVRDIELPVWIMDAIETGTPEFHIDNGAFNRLVTPETETLRLTILAFYDEDLAKEIAAGFGLVLPDGVNWGDHPDENSAAAVIAQILAYTYGIDVEEGDTLEDILAKLAEKLGITIEDGSDWMDILYQILDELGIPHNSLQDLLNWLSTYFFNDPNAITGEDTWETIFDKILDKYMVEIEWLEEPQIDFGGTNSDGKPRVDLNIERKEGYSLSSEQFRFRVSDVPEKGTVSFGSRELPVITVSAGNITWTSDTEGNVPIGFDAFDAAINRRVTYWTTGTGATAKYNKYHPADTDFRDATGQGEQIDEPGSRVAESHIIKLTADDIGVAEYYTVYDTIYCRVTFFRDNVREYLNGNRNENFSVNYTTKYEFFSPYELESIEGKENEYEKVNDTNIDQYFNVYSSCIVDNISFKGMFGEPQKLIYDLNLNGAKNASAALKDMLNVNSLKFEDGMLPEVWMTPAFPTYVQGGVPSCTATTTNAEGKEIKLVFAGWSTDPTDTSVYDDAPAEGMQFEQPYGMVKDKNSLPDEITLYAVWKESTPKTVYIQYGDDAQEVRTAEGETTDFSDTALQPKKYGYDYNGYGLKVTGGRVEKLFNADGELVEGIINAMNAGSPEWTNVYSIFLEYRSMAFKWLNVQMKTLTADWNAVSDEQMTHKITFYAPGTDQEAQVFSSTFNSAALRGIGSSNTMPVVPTAPAGKKFTGWYTSRDLGICVVDENNRLVEGTWSGGVYGWTTGTWTDGSWKTPLRWVITNDRALYAHFEDINSGN